MILVDRGLLSYEDKVAMHWPDFAQGGKENITISDVLRHEGGLPYFARDFEDWYMGSNDFNLSLLHFFLVFHLFVS